MAYQELKNEFSWSKSRHGKFEECRRLYWFHYYGSWGGWKEDAAREAREAYVLKNLSSRQQWAGNVVHDTVAFALASIRAGQAPALEMLVARARARMRDDFKNSRDGIYRQRPKKTVGLVEHELKEAVSDSEWKANWDNAERSLRNFYSSHWLETAKNLPANAWLPIDAIDSFILDGIKVYAGPDFAFRDGDGAVIVDWKTGRPRDEDREQIKAYTLFAQSKWKCAPSSVVARLVYLGINEEVSVRVDAEALERFQEHFRKSVAGMKQLLRDSAVNVAVKDDFIMTDDLARCRACAFRRMCERDCEAVGPAVASLG